MTDEYPIKSPRKLIEVALPLDTINMACDKERNPFLKRHPRAIHLWWARRPLAAARAVIFAQMVNDPGYQHGGGFKYGTNKKEAAKERERLFGIIEELVLWENTTNEEVLAKARAEIQRSWQEVCDLNKDHPLATTLFNPDKLPTLRDPFAGGGAIPMEGHRLGLESLASDLNPVPVLINMAMNVVPPRFKGCSPVNPTSRAEKPLVKSQYRHVDGLIEDIRFYGKWLRDEAETRLRHLYPNIAITAQMATDRPDLHPYVGEKLQVVAYLWAHTVRSPNPGFSHCDVPLVSSFTLSRKKGKKTWVEPVIRNGNDGYDFVVRVGGTPTLERTVERSGGNCLFSGTPIPFSYIREEGRAGRLGDRLLAIVVKGKPGKLFLSPTPESEALARQSPPDDVPASSLPQKAISFRVQVYGITEWRQLFSPRQQIALKTFCDLVQEARQRVLSHARDAHGDNSDRGLEDDGSGSEAYADAISLYLAMGVSQYARYSSINCTWNKTNENIVQTFGRQAVPIVWDYAESNPLDGSLSIEVTIGWVADALLSVPSDTMGRVQQADARTPHADTTQFVVSTDPPYYDNIGYADLSDFFYLWLRQALRPTFPKLLATISVPKAEELIATQFRHESKAAAEQYFLDGMSQAMRNISANAHPAFPMTIYYAFKQSESSTQGTSSTGWETFLEAVVGSGLQLAGTWPIRTEKIDALKKGVNALASSIVLVCHERRYDAPACSRREFIRELNQVLPDALDEMTRGAGEDHSSVAPVDLSQAIIGPGMAVFSRYSAVLEADGSSMTVRTALQLINRFLAEDDFDKDTQFCLHWFEQYGWDEGAFGEADVLARAKATAVDALDEAGVAQSGGGSVRLLRCSNSR